MRPKKEPINVRFRIPKPQGFFASRKAIITTGLFQYARSNRNPSNSRHPEGEDPPFTLLESGFKAFIETACVVFTDDETMIVAREMMMKRGGNAERFLNYYLSGGVRQEGLNVESNTRNIDVGLHVVIAEDEGVRSHLYAKIAEAIGAGRLSGEVEVPQSIYTNQDWRYAIGGMVVQWEMKPDLDGGNVELTFENLYRYHPEAKRISQCVHQSAVRLKNVGAKEFLMVGSAVIDVSEDG